MLEVILNTDSPAAPPMLDAVPMTCCDLIRTRARGSSSGRGPHTRRGSEFDTMIGLRLAPLQLATPMTATLAVTGCWPPQ